MPVYDQLLTSDLLRGRKKILLAKLETTEGEDASPVPGSDAIIVNSLEAQPQAALLPSRELRGIRDEGEFDIGGMSFQIATSMNLKPGPDGSTPPEIDPILQICGFEREINASIEGTATGGTEGDADGPATVTVDRSVDTDFPAADGALVGQPIIIGFSPTPVVANIISYEVTGSVVTIGVGKVLPEAPTTESVEIPDHVLYKPREDDDPSATFHIYVDGVRWRFLGARGTFDLALAAGGKADLNATITALFQDKTDEALPTPSYQHVRPGIWRDGIMTIDSLRAAVRELTINPNNSVVLPGDPNAQEGFIPPMIPARDIQGQMNPKATLVATRDLFGDFRAGTKRAVAVLLPGVASPKHYTSIVMPTIKYRDNQMGDDGELVDDVAPFSALNDFSETPERGEAIYIAFFHEPSGS